MGGRVSSCLQPGAVWREPGGRRLHDVRLAYRRADRLGPDKAARHGSPRLFSYPNVLGINHLILPRNVS